MTALRRHRCDRVRQWASLRLDEELSELESRLADHHLRRCRACRDFADDLREHASALRETPLEPFRVTIALPRRRRRTRAVQAGAAALAAAAAVVGSVGLAGQARHGVQAPQIHVSSTPDDMVGVSVARRARLIAQTPHFWAGPRGFQLT